MRKYFYVDIFSQKCKKCHSICLYIIHVPVEWKICRHRLERLWPPEKRSRRKALKSQWWLLSKTIFIIPGEWSSSKPGYRVRSCVYSVRCLLVFLLGKDPKDPLCFPLLLSLERMFSSSLSWSRNFSAAGPRSRWLKISRWEECSIPRQSCLENK